MRKLLIYLDESNIESVNSQIVKKIENEVEEIDVILNKSNSLKVVPSSWKVIDYKEINEHEFVNGAYIHAVDSDSPLISMTEWDKIFTILFTDNEFSNEEKEKFDLIVMKSKTSNFVDNDKNSANDEFIINTENTDDVENFIHNFVDVDKVKLTVSNSNENILQFSRKNESARLVLEFLVSHDYTLVNFENDYNIFIQRKLLSKYLPENILGLKLREREGVFYTFEPKIKKDNNAPERLIIIFSSMPGPNEYYSSKFEERSFVKHFPTIQKLLVPNTNVLRIMDSNLLYGSHYINSSNFNNYEDIVQHIIASISKKFNISNNNIILYGTSKGGTGALIHSLIGNYKSVTVDPIIDATEYNENMHNIHYIKGNREQSLITKINSLTQNDPGKNILIRSPQVKFNFNVTKNILNDSICFYDQQNSNIDNHTQIGKNTVSEILMFLNAQLLGLTFETGI